jgi:hypothetical protein
MPGDDASAKIERLYSYSEVLTHRNIAMLYFSRDVLRVSLQMGIPLRYSSLAPSCCAIGKSGLSFAAFFMSSVVELQIQTQ